MFNRIKMNIHEIIIGMAISCTVVQSYQNILPEIIITRMPYNHLFHCKWKLSYMEKVGDLSKSLKKHNTWLAPFVRLLMSTVSYRTSKWFLTANWDTFSNVFSIVPLVMLFSTQASEKNRSTFLDELSPVGCWRK